MKNIPQITVALSALFLLTACPGGEDSPEPVPEDQKHLQPVAATGPNDQFQPPRAAAGVKSTLQDERFLQLTFEITTRDGRDLHVTATAYCEKLDELGPEAYRQQCGLVIGKSLNYFAKDRKCFESAIPAVSAAVRNHEGLPPSDGYCDDEYPPNYAPWPEDMMRRTLEQTPKDNLYTVTKITPR